MDQNHEPKKIFFKRKFNINNKITGLIAAPALIENAIIIPVTMNAYANDLLEFDIILLDFYIK